MSLQSRSAPSGSSKVTHSKVISDRFVKLLLEALGFNDKEQRPQFKTGSGGDKADFAARKNNGNDIFFDSQKNPYLLVEVKARATGAGAKINLSEGTPQYIATREQIKKYLLAPNCQTSQWGIITNSVHIQLLRRHGKVVFPATGSILIKKDNINQTISYIKQLIDNPPKALTVCIYNNKCLVFNLIHNSKVPQPPSSHLHSP